MTGAGIFDGYILVVDKAKRPQPGDVVLAIVGAEFLVADSTPFGHSAHADPDTCSTLIRTGSRSAATQG
ncbi:MAG: hypothetical protein DI559_13795, partial [Ectopseudomonas oleovorans]